MKHFNIPFTGEPKTVKKYFEMVCRRAHARGFENKTIADMLQTSEVEVEKVLMNKQVVRCVLHTSQMSEAFRSFISAMQLVTTVRIHRDDASGMCFDIITDKVDELVFYFENTPINAVKAPEWSDE